jgi:predicted RNA-binding protein YlxR (DUF448 family)
MDGNVKKSVETHAIHKHQQEKERGGYIRKEKKESRKRQCENAFETHARPMTRMKRFFKKRAVTHLEKELNRGVPAEAQLDISIACGLLLLLRGHVDRSLGCRG